MTIDMHRRNAAKAFGIPVEQVTEEQRAFAKRCAFGARGEADALHLTELGLRMGYLFHESKKA